MKLKKLLLFLLVGGLLALGIGYYLYNKGPIDVKRSDGIRIDAVSLYDQFDQDTVLANSKYAGKILEVQGIVTNISTNQANSAIVMLQTHSDAANINCTMEEIEKKLKVNDQVIIKGICAGIGQGSEDLGLKGDVYLTRCVLLK